MSGINNTWVRHCHVIENCTTTDHKISLDFSSLRRQKNRPFLLRFEDADWQNFMSHLEYIYILNQDLTKFYKDPPPVGDFSIAPQLKLRRADRQRGHIVMVKTYIFHRRFSNISHHTNIHSIIYIIIILCVWFREDGALAPSIGQPLLRCTFAFCQVLTLEGVIIFVTSSILDFCSEIVKLKQCICVISSIIYLLWYFQ